MLAFLSVGLPLLAVAVLGILFVLFERLLDRFPGLERSLFRLMGC